MKTLISARKLLQAVLLVGVVATLASCDALQILAPAVANARNFAFAHKKLPNGTTLATARAWMIARDGGARPGFPAEDSLFFFSDTTISTGAEWYSGHKPNNTANFRLDAFQPGGASTQGQLFIQVRDGNTEHLLQPGHIGSTGANISVVPLPRVRDTVTSADFHFFFTADGSAERPTEYFNLNDANSYFRLVLDSLDMTNHVAVGKFEGIVQAASSGPHAGEIFAITDGEFIMDIHQ